MFDFCLKVCRINLGHRLYTYVDHNQSQCQPILDIGRLDLFGDYQVGQGYLSVIVLVKHHEFHNNQMYNHTNEISLVKIHPKKFVLKYF